MRRAFGWILVSFVILFVGACEQPSPEEQVAEVRAKYEARINSFFVREVPVEGAEAGEPMDESMAADDEGMTADEDSTADDSSDEMMAPETIQEVTLDIIVQHDAAKALPGVTLDITLVDANQNPKGSWRLWVDTEGLPKANQKQITHVLTEVGYEDGDGWNVEVRRPIPPEERGDYQEFPG